MQNKYQSSALAPNIMVHFYRGVMDLATTWRSRIDSTTNWAVISSGSIASFLLSDPEHSHIMALLGMFLGFAFLCIEARRFRYYDLWSNWVRVMEIEYYEPILRSNIIRPDEQWHRLLDYDLNDPHFKISWTEAMGRRLRHNYWAIFGFLLLTWCTKLLLHPHAATWGTAIPTMRQRAALGPISGNAIIFLVFIFYSYLILLIMITPRLLGAGSETLSRSTILRQLSNPLASTAGFLHYDNDKFDHVASGTGHAPEED
ncbi:MAG: DUF2270 domain-containing protein [Herpetosiphonaceae bacterium]|nr:DUF2270 domain-containing protein [Herpetosiphonaceae bacterium]